ncbi:MAG: acyltransferase [Candidatus Omnitrophica bacterium]|nr:acyltransferase [Candidatus Omnitrophota bacterium]
MGYKKEKNMIYQFFLLVSRLYTSLIRSKFYYFGEKSIIKPILNSSNESFISIGRYVNIGSFCRITVSTKFGGYKVKSDNKVRIKIGDNVDIGNNVFISANNYIEIENHVIMSSYVFITDHNHGFSDIDKSLHEQPLTEGGHVRIGNNVFLGEKCSVLRNVVIGEKSVVAANAVVTKDVPAYSIVAGNPAKIIKKYDFKQKKWTKVE